MVASVCAQLGVTHSILPVTVAEGASLQAQARDARYQALAAWASQRELVAVATAHHLEDQAETLLMRLARGSGLSGLAGVRPKRPLGAAVLVRPLLGWHKGELVRIVEAAGLRPIDDPANRDPRHDRTRARALLAGSEWLNPSRLAAASRHLGEAEEAVAFAARSLFGERARAEQDAITLTAADLPRELQRRIVLRAIERLGDPVPRGADLDRALDRLADGRSCTLGSLKLVGGTTWRLSRAPPRRVSSRPAESP